MRDHSYKNSFARSMQQGFSLVELMTVVAIMAIALLITVPSFKDYTIRTQVVEGLNLAIGIKNSINEYWSAKGVLPKTNINAGIADALSITSNVVSRLDINDGQIAITYGNNANSGLIGGILTMTPLENAAGSLVWTCGVAASPMDVTVIPDVGNTATSISNKHLPPDCRV